MDFMEEFNAPLVKMQCVDIVRVLFAFIHLTLDPVPVEIPEQMMDVFSGDRVAIPFPNIERKQSLVSMSFGLLV